MRQRPEILERIRTTVYDVCVIGGGASGAGCALDAQLRGLKTVLVEAVDFGSATSSASTKLIHGGLRYLQQVVTALDFGQYRVVRRALRERVLMLENAPHLTRVLQFLVPCHTLPAALYYSLGLKIYYWLAGRAVLSSAIGITNQRETTVVWNRKTGVPVTNAIVWQDMRVAGDVAECSRSGGPDRLRAQTGLPLSTYFSGLKIRWILQNVAGVRELADSGDLIFGTIDTFLVWHLTGGPKGGLHITDVTNGSRTQLMNLQTLDWDREILTAFEIPEALLPRICPSSGVLGEIRYPELEGIPLGGILGDQQAALVGQACFDPGDAKNTYGTGCFL